MRKKAYCKADACCLQYYRLHNGNACGFKHLIIDCSGGTYFVYLKHKKVK